MAEAMKPNGRSREALKALLELTLSKMAMTDRFFTPREVHYTIREERIYNAKDMRKCIEGIRSYYVNRAVIIQGSKAIVAYRANLGRRRDIEAELRRKF